MRIQIMLGNRAVVIEDATDFALTTTEASEGIIFRVFREVSSESVLSDDDLVNSLILEESEQKPGIEIGVSADVPAGVKIATRFEVPISEKSTDHKPLFNKTSSSNAPSKDGILVENRTVVGNKFELSEEYGRILNQLRRDFTVEVASDVLITKRKMLKKNEIIRSDVFNKLDDVLIRKALQNLVIKEQQHTRTIDRENLIYVEIPLKLVVESVTDEQSGEGSFYYEEMISIYENIFTLRTPKKDN